MTDSFLSDCERLFGTEDLYEILSLDKDDKYEDGQVKRAYYKASLVYHPDRAHSSNEKHSKQNTEKFQVLSRAYELLKTAKLRNRYNKTGEIDVEGLESDEETDWYTVWRSMFRPISAKDIDKLSKEYKGSEEEREDLLAAYTKFEGNFAEMLEHILLGEVDEEERYIGIMQPVIESGGVEKYAAWKSSTGEKASKARKRKADKEEKEADELASELAVKHGAEGNDLDSLAAAILGKNKSRQQSMIEGLEAKYCAAPKGKKKTK